MLDEASEYAPVEVVVHVLTCATEDKDNAPIEIMGQDFTEDTKDEPVCTNDKPAISLVNALIEDKNDSLAVFYKNNTQVIQSWQPIVTFQVDRLLIVPPLHSTNAATMITFLPTIMPSSTTLLFSIKLLYKDRKHP